MILANEKSKVNRNSIKKKLKIIPIIAISLSLLIPVFAFLPVGTKAYFGYFNVDYPGGNSTFWASYRNIEGYPYPESYGWPIISGWGGDMGTLNPDGYNYGFRSYMVTSHFNIFDYPWNYVYDPYTDTYNEMWEPALDADVISVYAYIRGFTEMNEGWFSVRYNTTTSWYDSTVWLHSGAYYSSSPKGANYNSSGWSNSTLFPYTTHSSTSWWVTHEWNITSLYDWNVSMLKTCQYPDTSAGLNIMWTTIENNSMMVYDYLGIRYTCYGTYQSGRPAGFITPDITFDKNISGLIWLLVLFIPAMMMGQVIPKYGFVAGIVLMLVILTATQVNFLSVSVIGFVGIAVMLYKKGV